MPDPPPAARFMLGTALYESGATVAGELQFRAVLERQPHSSRARVALGEALLAQRRYGEAADTAASSQTTTRWRWSRSDRAVRTHRRAGQGVRLQARWQVCRLDG